MSNQQQVRKKFFTEVGADEPGELGADFQEAFELAQMRARDRGVVCTATLKIHVAPPKADHPDYGQVAYAINVTDPPKKSMAMNTKLRDGMIVSTAGDIGGLNQLRLDFPDYGRHQAPAAGRVNTETGEIIDDNGANPVHGADADPGSVPCRAGAESQEGAGTEDRSSGL